MNRVCIHTAFSYWANVLQVRPSDGETLVTVYPAEDASTAIAVGIGGTITVPEGASFCEIVDDGVLCHFPEPSGGGTPPTPVLLTPAQVAHDLSISICGVLSI